MAESDKPADGAPDESRNLTYEELNEYLCEKARGEEDYEQGVASRPVLQKNLVFFETDAVMIPYRNGIVTPKNFMDYEDRIRKLIGYVDKVIKAPNKTQPALGLRELANLKVELLCGLADIDRYFDSGGIFYEEELVKVQDCLEGRLTMLEGPIGKLTNLMRKVNHKK